MIFGLSKWEALGKRAMESAEQAKREEERGKKMEPVYGRAQAKKDLREWQRRIEDQMRNWPGMARVRGTVGGEDQTVYRSGGLFGWGTHISTIEAGTFLHEAFRTAYVDELQKLLGLPFKVYGSGTEYGDVITSELPYPHSDVVREAFVGARWG